MNDRYEINKFIELSRDLRVRDPVDQQNLGELVRAGALGHELEEELGRPHNRTVPITLHLANSTAFNVGRTLADVDIELRRAASYLTTGSLRPLKSSVLVEVSSAERASSVAVTLLVSQNLFDLLTSRPFDFLLILSWLWEHRLSRTRARVARDGTDHLQILNQVARSSSECLPKNKPVMTTLDIRTDGSARFEFCSADIPSA